MIYTLVGDINVFIMRRKHANTASTSTTTSAYPNKRPATSAKPTAAATVVPAVTPESKPATVPRTWAPIPKVVPVPPVVIPKEEPITPPPPSPPFQEIKSSASTKQSKPTASSSSTTVSKSTTPKVSKKPVSTEKHVKKAVVPLVPEEDEKPALPATASWAKAQPVVNHESVITPANFGPSLSDALNAPQKPKHSPSLKVKKEKKNKGKMVRLEEFEEAEREAKMAAIRPKVVSKPEVAPIASPVVAHSIAPVAVPVVAKFQSPVEVESGSPDAQVTGKSTTESKLALEKEVEKQHASPNSGKEKELQEVESGVPVVDEPMPEMLEVKKSDVAQQIDEESQLKEEDIPMELDQSQSQTNNDDVLMISKEGNAEDLSQIKNEAERLEDGDEKIQNLASLNDNIIKAFDDAAAAAADESSEKVQSDETLQETEDSVSDSEQFEIEEQKLVQNISSPLAAMDRLSALVQQEIMVDSPEQPSFNGTQQQPHPSQPQQPHPGMNRFDLGMPMQPDNRRMAPPGLSGPPPPPPDWMNRSFDPFNGQDPSLIAARRLQHSQRMLEASGLFAGGGFGHPPVVPRFGFSPDFSRGPNGFMPHQAPPPPPMGMFPPPPHPMMRHPPPPEMMNMQPPFGPPPPQIQQQQMEELRNEFNGMNMNGNDEHHQQSRDDLRALLPNVKISFNNLQEKRRAEEFYQQQLIMQRQQQQQQMQQQQQQMQQQQMQQQQMHMQQQQQQHIQQQQQYQHEQRMSEQEQIPTRLDSSDNNITNNSSRHSPFTDNSSPSTIQSVQEKVLLKSPMNQQWQPNQLLDQREMEEKKNNPDVRVEAQNFFGEFLRKAASSTQQEMSPKRDEQPLQPAGRVNYISYYNDKY